MLCKCERQHDSSVQALSEHSRKLRLVEKAKEEFYSEDVVESQSVRENFSKTA